MTEEAVAAAAVSVAEEAAAEAVSDQAVREICIKQPAQTAAKRQKYLSFLPVTDLYTAGNATRNINQKDIKIIKYLTYIIKKGRYI